MSSRTCQFCSRYIPPGNDNCPFCSSQRSEHFTASQALFSTPSVIWWLLNSIVICLLLLNVVVLALPAPSERQSTPRIQSTSAPVSKTFADADGRIQVIATSDWSSDPAVFPESVLFIQNPKHDVGIVVFAEEKAALTTAFHKLDAYGSALRELLLNELQDGTQTAPVSLKVGGHLAVQSRIEAGHDGTRVTFLHTVVETSRTYYQIRAFTTAENFKIRQEELLDITARIQFPPRSSN
ncbi:zinc ribbon domain-containing protein [Anatilimnocola floriformis]|uniref:zinc ribbon domain-containing protein n=1 Tax=Anatilimnocola floriformis TaxID=2948575 RepID=UPI0020C58B5E|nr:zinc ribbon domain-containing protein [Anatilimnocola floriformis]